MLVQRNGADAVRLDNDMVCYHKPILKCWSFGFLDGCAKAEKLRLFDAFVDFELNPEKKTFKINEKCYLSGKIFGKIGVEDETDYETARLIRIEKIPQKDAKLKHMRRNGVSDEVKDSEELRLYRAVTSGGDQFYFFEDDQDHYWFWT